MGRNRLERSQVQSANKTRTSRRASLISQPVRYGETPAYTLSFNCCRWSVQRDCVRSSNALGGGSAIGFAPVTNPHHAHGLGRIVDLWYCLKSKWDGRVARRKGSCSTAETAVPPNSPVIFRSGELARALRSWVVGQRLDGTDHTIEQVMCKRFRSRSARRSRRTSYTGATLV